VSVEFCGLTLAHRVLNGSGTFDVIAARRAFGAGLDEQFPFAAYVSKTITLAPRAGNPPPRLWETAGGLINSIGLPNKGLDDYLADDLPQLASLSTAEPLRGHDGGDEREQGTRAARWPVPLITNVMGSSADEFSQLIEACDAREEIAAIELNVSCPNVETGLDIGSDPGQLEAVVARVRGLSRKPLIVKLTPNSADVARCALAAQAGGADAVSLINTLRAMALVRGADGQPARAWLGGGTGGLSGPAVRAVALAQVSAVAAQATIPIVAMGGVERTSHAADLLDAGATLVAVGTASFRDPSTAARIARGLAREGGEFAR
jgi:dihydroorotate dehydrogenase (NAD+) catalytic subunit